MAFSVRYLGSWREVGSGKFWVRDAGSWKPIVAAWVRDAGTWKQFFVNMTVTAQSIIENDGGSSSSGTVTTTFGDTNTTVTGGTGTIDFLWEHVSTSSGQTPNINLTTARDPVWSGPVSDGTNSVSTWRLTVTDENGSTADVQITVTLIWTNQQ